MSSLKSILTLTLTLTLALALTLTLTLTVGVDKLVEEHLGLPHCLRDGRVLHKGDEVKVGGLGQKTLWHRARARTIRSACLQASQREFWPASLPEVFSLSKPSGRTPECCQYAARVPERLQIGPSADRLIVRALSAGCPICSR